MDIPPSLVMFLLSAAVAGAATGAITRGSLTIVIATVESDDRAGAPATFFTAGYVGISLPVVGMGLPLQPLSPRVTLLILGSVIGLAVLAAAPILVRPVPEATGRSELASDAITGMCRYFYQLLFSNDGGIPLEHRVLIDDNRACALEYNVVRWGQTELPPEAGVAV